MTIIPDRLNDLDLLGPQMFTQMIGDKSDRILDASAFQIHQPGHDRNSVVTSV